MKKLKKILRKSCAILPRKLVIYIDYIRSYKMMLNLKNPKYYGEKIQWIKLYGNLERFAPYVDKYEVRKFVKDTIGEEHLPKLYGVYERTEEIDFNKLPKQFVLKMNNGSGGNIICKDKDELNKKQCIKTLNKWSKEKFYKYTKENQYKGIKAKIICEEYLEDETGSLRDYKLHCTNGKTHIIEVHTDRFKEHKMNFYSADWEKWEAHDKYAKEVDFIEKPEKLSELLYLAELLSKDFSYVRVDFYIANGKVYFGELTFTQSSGAEPYFPLEKDLEIAEIIDIHKYNL